jgi:hypothetical protein
MMPQYMPMAAPVCNPCQAAAQPMYVQAQPAYYAEPGCAYVEPGCGGPYMGAVSYGPSMPCDCGQCSSGCCDGAAIATPPAPEAFTPTPGND